MILAQTEDGDGPPLVLLHGLFGAGQNWGAIRRALAPRYRILAPDLRNHGASPRAAAMDYPTLADDVAETLDAAGVARREADAHLAAAIPEGGIRAFLLQSLRFEADPPAWRLGLAELAAAMPAIEDFAPPPGARYDGPVLVMGGELSGYIRPEHHAAFRALFPRVAFTTIPKAGHWVHAENPQGFLAALEPFLAG